MAVAQGAGERVGGDQLGAAAAIGIDPRHPHEPHTFRFDAAQDVGAALSLLGGVQAVALDEGFGRWHENGPAAAVGDDG